MTPRVPLAVGAAVSALTLALAGPASAEPASACAGADRLDLGAAAQARVMVCLTNEERTERGLPPLEVDARLVRSAGAKSTAMLRTGDFSHTPGGMDFTTTFRRAGYDGSGFGENIAWGSGDLGSPAAIHRAWMTSPPHRRNILGRGWTEMGVAVKRNVRFQGYAGAAVWTAQFGSG